MTLGKKTLKTLIAERVSQLPSVHVPSDPTEVCLLRSKAIIAAMAVALLLTAAGPLSEVYAMSNTVTSDLVGKVDVAEKGRPLLLLTSGNGEERDMFIELSYRDLDENTLYRYSFEVLDHDYSPVEVDGELMSQSFYFIPEKAVGTKLLKMRWPRGVTSLLNGCVVREALYDAMTDRLVASKLTAEIRILDKEEQCYADR